MSSLVFITLHDTEVMIVTLFAVLTAFFLTFMLVYLPGSLLRLHGRVMYYLWGLNETIVSKASRIGVNSTIEASQAWMGDLLM